MSAQHRIPSLVERACPGPGDIGASDAEPCPRGAMIGRRGAHAQRCRYCTDVRNNRCGARAQRALKRRREQEGLKVATGIKRAGQGKTPKALPSDAPYRRVKRCKVCCGDPHLREPGREDEMGRPVCLPGSNCCRGCDQPYIPEPEIHARGSIGSSAATAIGACTW